MEVSFKATKRVSRCGGSACVYLSRAWGVKPSQMVDVRVEKADGSEGPRIETKKVSRDKAAPIIYLDKVWGFEVGDLVRIEITPRSDFDGRVGDQEED